MPPKGWKKYADGFKPVDSTTGLPLREKVEYAIDDLLLPRTVISRLAKEVLPEESQLPKDGVTALQRSTTLFINYLTHEANLIALGAGRKTITSADVFRALENVNLGAFVPGVQSELSKHEAYLAQRKANKRTEGPEDDTLAVSDDEEEAAKDAGDVSKRQRLDTPGDDETEVEDVNRTQDMDTSHEHDTEEPEDEGDEDDDENDDDGPRIVSSMPDEKELEGETVDEIVDEGAEAEEDDDGPESGHWDVK